MKWNAFTAHLQQLHRADRVVLTRIEHRQPTDGEFLDGMQLDDPRLYRKMSETEPSRPRAETSPGRLPLRLTPPQAEPELLP